MGDRQKFLLFGMCVIAVFMSSVVFAQDSPSGVDNTSVTSPQTIIPDTTVTSDKAARIKAHKDALKASGPMTHHSLADIKFKIDRAMVDLEKYGSDLGGHRSAAVGYLKQALQELQDAK